MYAIYDANTGEIIQTVLLDPEANAAGVGGWIEVPDNVSAATHWVSSGVLREYSSEGKARLAEPPGRGFVWSPVNEAWADNRTANEARTDNLQRLRSERDRRIESGFTWDGSVFDSDAAISQPRLLGLFTTATAGGFPPEGYPWRLADNSWRVLSAQDAVAIWGAFQVWMAGHFAAFAVHESALINMTDVAQLRAYDITAGWPS